MAYPTVVSACDVNIMLDDDGGTPVDISGQSNEVSISMTSNTGRAKTFGNPWLTAIVCGQQAEITLRVVFTTAGNQGRALLEDWYANHPLENRTLTVSVPDDSVGSQQYSMECKLSSLNIPLSADSADPVVEEATLINDGGLTISTKLS